MILKTMTINDLGCIGTARKLHYKLGNSNYYFYYYKGNSAQNFVVDEDGNNITNKKIGQQILSSGMNYIFYHDYGA